MTDRRRLTIDEARVMVHAVARKVFQDVSEAKGEKEVSEAEFFRANNNFPNAAWAMLPREVGVALPPNRWAHRLLIQVALLLFLRSRLKRRPCGVQAKPFPAQGVQKSRIYRTRCVRPITVFGRGMLFCPMAGLRLRDYRIHLIRTRVQRHY